MKEIRLKISDIFEIEPQIPDQPRGLAAITAYVLKHYAFLPQPIAVTVEGDEVVISYPEEADTKREEAARLAVRAVKRASEGNYEKAIGIYKRVLELQPSFHAARRDLAMAHMELGDVENATNHRAVTTDEQIGAAVIFRFSIRGLPRPPPPARCGEMLRQTRLRRIRSSPESA